MPIVLNEENDYLYKEIIKISKLKTARILLENFDVSAKELSKALNLPEDIARCLDKPLEEVAKELDIPLEMLKSYMEIV